MKNNAIGILSILFIILLLLVIYYISVCDSTVENFKDSKKKSKDLIIGEKVSDASSAIRAASTAMKVAANKALVAYQEINSSN